MATRFYFSAATTPPNSPGFEAWTRTSEGVRRKMDPTKDGAAMTNFTAWANAAAGANTTALFAQFASRPLKAGIVFTASESYKCVVRCQESAANDNINRTPSCVKIYNGTTLKRTRIDLGAHGPNTTEWNTSLRNKQLLDGDASIAPDYTTVIGDYLVLEVGGQVDATGGTSVTGTMSIGSNSATDLAENETGTVADNPWFETSLTLHFDEIVQPSTLALATTTFAPTVIVGTVVRPVANTLSTTLKEPAIRIGTVVKPSAASLAISTFAPSVAIGANVTVSPPVSSLALATFAPTVLTPRLVSPSSAALALSTSAPTLRLDKLVQPSSSPLALSTFAPTLRLDKTVAPPVAPLTLTTSAPTLQTPVNIKPPVSSLTLTSFAPDVVVTTGSGVVISPPVKSLALATFAPTVLTPRLVSPSSAALALSPSAPALRLDKLVQPSSSPLALSTFAPTLRLDKTVAPPVAPLTLTTSAPTLQTPTTVNPAAINLVISTFGPSLVIGSPQAGPFVVLAWDAWQPGPLVSDAWSPLRTQDAWQPGTLAADVRDRLI